MDNKAIQEKLYNLPGYKHYSKNQLIILTIAIKENLDLTHLASYLLTHSQMLEILKGLRLGLDVSVYAKYGYSIKSMIAIRDALSKQVNIAPYVKTEFREGRILTIVKAAERGDFEFLDLYKDNNELTEERFLTLYKAYKKGFDLSVIESPELVSEILIPIVGEAIDKDINIDRFLKMGDFYSPYKIREMIMASFENVDTHYMENPEFTSLQMRQIRIGLLKGVDVSVYANPNMSVDKMKQERVKQEQKMLKDNENSINMREIFSEAEKLTI